MSLALNDRPLPRHALPAPPYLSKLAHGTPPATTAEVTFGLWYVLSVPVMAGVAPFVGEWSLGGLRLTGWLWSATLYVGLLLLLTTTPTRKNEGAGFPLAVWMPWLLLVWVPLAWCEGVGFHNVQDAIQLSMPLLVGVLSMRIVRSRRQLQMMYGSFTIALVIVLSSLLLRQAGWMGVKGQSDRAGALSAALCGLVLASLFPRRKTVAVAGWTLGLLGCWLSGSRMATVALLAVPVLHPLVRGMWTRLAVVGLLATTGWMVFRSQTFQERFFTTGAGGLADVYRGDMLDFGRFDAWPLILNRAVRSPLLGWGTGSAYDYVPKVWPGMRQVHNDYLRVFFETGVLGLAAFLGAMAWQVWDVRRRLTRSGGTLREAFAAALMGLGALLLTALTDNTLGYNLWFTNPLFALLGAAYGVAACEGQRPSATAGPLEREPQPQEGNRPGNGSPHEAAWPLWPSALRTEGDAPSRPFAAPATKPASYALWPTPTEGASSDARADGRRSIGAGGQP